VAGCASVPGNDRGGVIRNLSFLLSTAFVERIGGIKVLLFIGAGKIKPEKMEDVLEAIQKVMPTVGTEEGTLEYVVYRGIQDPNMLVFYEKYRDQEAQEAHRSSAEVQAFLQVIVPCLDGEPIMGVVEEIASARG
jgi:quinol monooxygenase YgiN